MKFKLPLELGSPYLKVFSSVSSNLAAGFAVLALGAKDQIILASDILAVVLCGIIAIKIEKILEDL